MDVMDVMDVMYERISPWNYQAQELCESWERAAIYLMLPMF